MIFNKFIGVGLMTYDDLLQEAETFELIVKEKPLRGHNGRIKANRIAIKNDLTETAKKCTLVEELGHYHTTVGNILDQTKVENRKQERIARAWGYRRLVDPLALINAKKEGIRNSYELAEYLSVTEEFIEEALEYYRQKYGNKYVIGDYVIQFEPLEVYKRVEFNPVLKK